MCPPNLHITLFSFFIVDHVTHQHKIRGDISYNVLHLGDTYTHSTTTTKKCRGNIPLRSRFSRKAWRTISLLLVVERKRFIPKNAFRNVKSPFFADCFKMNTVEINIILHSYSFVECALYIISDIYLSVYFRLSFYSFY